MEKILSIGRWLFPLSFIMYAGLHIGKPDVGASFVPNYLPFPYFWNYFTLVCIVAFMVSALTQKYDKLAYSLMAFYVLLMAFLVHLPRATGSVTDMSAMMTTANAAREMELLNVFRNIMVFAALLGFAKYAAKDKRIIG